MPVLFWPSQQLLPTHTSVCTPVCGSEVVRDLANDHLCFCPTFGVEQSADVCSSNSPTLCLCVFLLVWWSCQLPLAALQITKSSLTCWSPSQRRFTPCQTRQYQTATSRPWPRCVTWRTGSWWWTSAGLNISQVGWMSVNVKRVRGQDVHARVQSGMWAQQSLRFTEISSEMSPGVEMLD